MNKLLVAYWPLIVVLLLAFFMALALDPEFNVGASFFMGFFLCLLSMFKLFDIRGFAEGFIMYDILASHFKAYALCYPFLELLLGLSYLGGWWPLTTNILTFILMALGSIGVIKSLLSGLDVRCACLGTVLKVPLSTVSAVENIGMGLMALINIIELI